MSESLCSIGFVFLSFFSEVLEGGITCNFYIIDGNFVGNKYCQSGHCCNSNTADPCCHGNNGYQSFSSSLTTGQIAGIIFGGVIGAGVFIGCLMCILNRIRKQPTKEDNDASPQHPSVSCISPPMTTVSGEGYFNDGFYFDESHPYSTSNDEKPPSYDEVMGRLNQRHRLQLTSQPTT